MVSKCFRQLRLIRSCIRSLPFEAAKTAVVCFVVTQVDRCNSLLAGAPKHLLDRLQSVLNSAARLVCNRRKYDHVTPLLRDVLHWLPVQYRIDHELALLVYKSLHGMAPEYLRAFIHSFISDIYIAPLQDFYSEALPNTARTLNRSFTPKRMSNCE